METGFLLSADKAALPRVDFAMGGVYASVSGLPVVRLRNRAGAEIGMLIGWPIDPSGPAMLAGDITFDFDEIDTARFFSDHIEPLLGSFLAIISLNDDRRVYLDALGGLSCVFDPTARLAGSTAAALLTDAEYARRFDQTLYAALSVGKDGWFPAGLTAHANVQRLITNHYLDLDTWTQVRHTAHAAVTIQSSVGPPLDAIAAAIRETVIAIRDAGKPVAIGLTGGGDSRMLLAACRPLVDDVLFYTVAAPGAEFDVHRASEIARAFGLRHTILPYVKATEAQSLAWDRRVGHAVSTANRTMFPSVLPLKDHICIGGLGGEVGRCFLWPRMDDVPQVSERYIIDMLKQPRLPAVIDRVSAWLDALPECDRFRTLDLAYIELRMNSWANAQSYANPESTVIHPLASHAAISAMLALPPETRQNDGMVRCFIERQWPELLDFPINRYGDHRDMLKLLGKLANPARALRKMKQLVRTRV